MQNAKTFFICGCSTITSQWAKRPKKVAILIYIAKRQKIFEFSRLEHAFQEKKISKSKLDTTFWIFPHFFSTGRSAILPAGPLLLDSQYWKKCGKVQNVVSSCDFEIFMLWNQVDSFAGDKNT